MIEDEATVKRFFKEADRIRLQPENSSMEPIYARDVTDPRQGAGALPPAVAPIRRSPPRA